MKKIIAVLVFFIISFSLQAQEKSEFPVGLWIVVWDYSIMSWTDEDGVTQENRSWVPCSYAYIGEYQSDEYFYFRKDGTGVIFTRGMIVDENGLVTFVTEHNNQTGEYTEGNEPRRILLFTWEFIGDKIKIRAEEKQFFVNPDNLDTFRYYQESSRGNIEKTMDGYKLFEEYTIDESVKIKRVDPARVKEFLAQYDLEP